MVFFQKYYFFKVWWFEFFLNVQFDFFMVGQGETAGPESESDRRVQPDRDPKNQIEKIKRNHINLKFYTRILHKSASNDRPKLVGVYSKKGRDNFANQIVKQYLDSVESWLLLLEKLE